MSHPENPPRPVDGYDPDEPLVVRYADVIAARNAVTSLHNLLADGNLVEGKDAALDDQLQATCGLLKLAVDPDDKGVDHILTREEAVDFTRELRDRLGRCLPVWR